MPDLHAVTSSKSENKSMDVEDLTDFFLDVLDDDYKPIIDIINGRDTPISFDELNEKLINKELSLRLYHSKSSSLPTSENTANPRSNSGNFSNRPQRSSWVSSYQPSAGPVSGVSNAAIQGGRPPPRPYLGRCQWCRVQGHTVPQCLVFCQMQPTV